MSIWEKCSSIAGARRVIRFYDLDGAYHRSWRGYENGDKRFLASGMNMEEIAVKMDASVEDLTKLLNH